MTLEELNQKEEQLTNQYKQLYALQLQILGQLQLIKEMKQKLSQPKVGKINKKRKK